METTEMYSYTGCLLYGLKWTLERDCWLPNSDRAAVGRPTSSSDWRLILQNEEQKRRVFSLRYMYRITLQNVLLWNRNKYVFRHHQYCSYVTCSCHCQSLCRKNTKLQRACASGL